MYAHTVNLYGAMQQELIDRGMDCAEVMSMDYKELKIKTEEGGKE
jgi:hypothetical protein